MRLTAILLVPAISSALTPNAQNRGRNQREQGFIPPPSRISSSSEASPHLNLLEPRPDMVGKDFEQMNHQLQLDQQRLIEEQRQMEEKFRREEELRYQEQLRQEEEQRLEYERQMAEIRRQEEEQRIEEERQLQEQFREEEQRRIEEERRIEAEFQRHQKRLEAERQQELENERERRRIERERVARIAKERIEAQKKLEVEREMARKRNFEQMMIRNEQRRLAQQKQMEEQIRQRQNPGTKISQMHSLTETLPSGNDISDADSSTFEPKCEGGTCVFRLAADISYCEYHPVVRNMVETKGRTVCKQQRKGYGEYGEEDQVVTCTCWNVANGRFLRKRW